MKTYEEVKNEGVKKKYKTPYDAIVAMEKRIISLEENVSRLIEYHDLVQKRILGE